MCYNNRYMYLFLKVHMYFLELSIIVKLVKNYFYFIDSCEISEGFSLYKQKKMGTCRNYLAKVRVGFN